ncbi:cytidine deaminase-like protein [Phycomyces nitens]|nr:cytidine deaminase-like protein [Phycomyces nitens]
MSDTFTDSEQDARYMQLAIEQANLSIPVPGAYCVGAVLVKDDKVLSTGFSRELPGNTHAEECALAKIDDKALYKGATMYTTMEPCSVRLSGNRPCTDRLIEADIKRVVLGIKEPPHLVVCTGISQLQSHGIQVQVVPNVAEQCLAPNAHIKSEN